MYQDFGPPFDQAFNRLGSPGKPGDDSVQYDQGAGGDHAADYRVISPVHSILDGIAQNKQQDEVKRRQLADLALAGEAQKNEQKGAGNRIATTGR